MMSCEEIVAALPYRKPFLFVDEIEEVSSQYVRGNYRFREDEFFYEGHFVGNPVTPGVILTEAMAQIGLVALGIFLIGGDGAAKRPGQVAFTSSNINFFRTVKPGEKVVVEAQKIYWRMGKLKCKAEMTNVAGDRICSGELSGMIK